jgi:hypothetical protein
VIRLCRYSSPFTKKKQNKKSKKKKKKKEKKEKKRKWNQKI